MEKINEDLIFELLDDFTSDGKLYYDDETESIWMINPKTKKWIFELTKTGRLLYYYSVFVKIFKYVSMEYPDFNPYIKKWVERILQKEVNYAEPLGIRGIHAVERTLQKGIKYTYENLKDNNLSVERILQSGTELNSEENINESEESRLVDEEIIFELLDDFTSDTKLYSNYSNDTIYMINPEKNQWVFALYDSGNLWCSLRVFKSIFRYVSMEYPDFVPYVKKWVEKTLQKEVKDIVWPTLPEIVNVNNILKLGKEIKLNKDDMGNINEDKLPKISGDLILEFIKFYTSEGKIYYDKSSEIIWMIIPEKNEWIFILQKSGVLDYNITFFDTLFKYFLMESPKYVPYIKKWVESIIKRPIKKARRDTFSSPFAIQMAVNRSDEINNVSEFFSNWYDNKSIQIEKEIKLNKDDMRNINEDFDWRGILSNIVGDKVRATLGSIPGLNVPVGAASIILNYSELNDDMEKYYDLKKKFESGEEIENLLEEFDKVEDELKVDFIDMLQSAGEMAIPGFKIFNVFGMPILTSLSLESVLDELSKVLPFSDKVKDSMVPYLAAIKDIGEMKKKLNTYKDPETVLDKVLPQISEGKKKTGTKLCSRGKSAAKAKFDVYPSAYANGFAVQVCKGKIKGLDGKKRCSPPYC